jgi:hypothetical protein
MTSTTADRRPTTGRRALRVALLAALALVLAACTSSGAGRPDGDAPAPSSPGSAQPGVAWPAGVPAADAVTCPAPTTTVGTAAELTAALAAATPGAVIGLADGTYDGQFAATASGTAEQPIWLCGGPDAVLRGPGTESGIVLHLQQVSHWRLVGFTVREGQKGVMADGVSGSVVQGLTVTEIGDEGVHLRSASTGNVVRGLTVSHTGLRTVKFGEGIYVGSAKSNWCTVSDCGPDRSDHNVLVANTFSETTAENIDIKEGTTGGVIAGNTLDGDGLAGEADSWIDVKGNGWLIQGNRGTDAGRTGFEVNEQAKGWGTGNTFDANAADVRADGYGYELRRPTDRRAAGNRVLCTNTATAAAAGLTNTTCIPSGEEPS